MSDPTADLLRFAAPYVSKAAHLAWGRIQWAIRNPSTNSAIKHCASTAASNSAEYAAAKLRDRGVDVDPAVEEVVKLAAGATVGGFAGRAMGTSTSTPASCQD